MRVAVLGAGGWGTTLAIVLHLNGHEVTLWEFKRSYARQLKRTRNNKVYLPNIKIPDEIDITHSIEDAVSNKHLIALAIPTQYIRPVITGIKGGDFKDTIFVNLSKGIEKDTLLTVSQILKEEIDGLEDAHISVLSGPSHAEEVAKKIPTAVVAASKESQTAKQVQAAFMTSYLRVYSSLDLIGVELGGALKNVIAVGAGIIDGAGFGDNTKAAIMTRGIVEISRLGIKLGAEPETFSGLSGIGDLIVTCMSRHSRNRFVGEQIGKGKKLKQILKSMNMVAEGVETSRSVHQLAEKLQIETPISSSVYRILFEERDPIKMTYELMTRDMKPEN
jgi:glycerol-3-phosphate dehydrogenase (NAD(P)+)